MKNKLNQNLISFILNDILLLQLLQIWGFNWPKYFSVVLPIPKITNKHIIDLKNKII